MHYYKFNIADYRKDTSHLSWIEHYIYRSLLDWMYLDESPIPLDIQKILRFLRLDNDRSTDVEQVLNDFFTKTDEGYTQHRVERELSEFKRQKDTASKAGKASAEARKIKASKRPFNDRSTTVQPTINHKPLTINHNNSPMESRTRPRDSHEVMNFMRDLCEQAVARSESERFFDYYTANGWRVGKNPMKDWQATARNWIRRRDENSNPTVKQRESKSERSDRAAREYLESLTADDGGGMAWAEGNGISSYGSG